MTLQSSGAISLSQVNTELSLTATATVSLNDTKVRTLAGIASGIIALNNLYGKSNTSVSTGRGYVGGGVRTMVTFSSEYSVRENNIKQSGIDGINFSTDNVFNVSAILATARSNLTGVSSAIKGYFGGGFDNTNITNEIDGIQFSNETAINPAAALASAIYGAGGVNSSTNGYFCGGTNSINNKLIERLQFNTESKTTISAILVYARSLMASISSNSKGYLLGGSGVVYYNEIDGIQFSNETAINPAAALSVIKGGLTGFNSTLNGYTVGGVTNGYYTQTLERLQFSTETNSVLSNGLTGELFQSCSSNSDSKGYFGGGYGNAYTYHDHFTTLLFSNETITNTVITLTHDNGNRDFVQSGSL